ncbi:PP2C family protein-serine/threonine phosphatase [Kitasatospora sp. NPDC058478]|uniref:PP2C family protein-serine/threonine phosphatase n=1 Tax=unclassified Kitasatospora TaxID=2633591 RepID=UPI00365BE59E
MTAGHEPSDTTARALAETVRRLQSTAARVQADARARAVVDLATGILAERLGLLPAEAAARLARLAREAAVPVAALAADIAGMSGQPPGQPPGQAPGLLAGTAEPVTPALAAIADLQGVAEAVLEQTADALGAHAVALWLRLPGGVLALAAHAGLSAAEADAWSRVPPGVPTPAQRVVVGGAELWPGDPEAAGPSVGAGSARAVLPLIDAGRRRGALEVLWPAPAPAPAPAPVLGGPQRRRLHALADLCATLLADADADADADAAPTPVPVPPGDDTALLEGLPTPALLLEPVVRRGEVADFTLLRTNAHFRDPLGRPRDTLEGTSLLEVYPAACAGGLFERLIRVHETGVPLPGERVRLVFQQGGLALPATVLLAAAPVGGRVLVGWQTETARAGEAEQSALLRQAQRLARVAGFEECPADGRIRWSDGLHEIYGLPPDTDPVPLAQLARHAHPDDEPAIRRLLDTVQRRHRTASAVVRLADQDGTHRYTRVIAEPLLDDHGRLTGVRGAFHDVSAQHRTEVALGATRARLADSEQETADSERLALRLQQALLPAAPPPLGPAGLRAAVRYRPAAQHDRVGGDWYDVLLLPDKRVLLTVGDVAGHGVGAATGMVALRHALRGLAVTGAGPARMLEWANTVALREPGQITATAVCVLIDPAVGELRWARAGHLPPILVGADGAQVLPLPHGVLLGALDDARYEEHTAHLPPGDVLVLYTDGLVERRDRPVEESVDQLIRAAGAPGPDLERYLDRLLELSPADTDDDTCLIAVQSR